MCALSLIILHFLSISESLLGGKVEGDSDGKQAAPLGHLQWTIHNGLCSLLALLGLLGNFALSPEFSSLYIFHGARLLLG